MGKLREKFWIIQSRRAIRKIVNRCVRCRRFAAKSCEVEAAPLPKNRVLDAAVFQITGVDLAGPLFLADGSKVWIVLFTCAVYRAVHLELVAACSTEAFILALSRFISRRGRPTTIYSDNGTNFVGTDNIFKKLDWKKIESTASVQKIQWIMNPPSSPWWGGFWERLVRSVKDLLKRMLGKSRVNLEQLSTCICEVESVINARPLTYVTEDNDDLIPLTPSIFMQSQTRAEFPELREVDQGALITEYKAMQILRRELRERFRKEYLGLLVQRGNERKSRYQLEEGDIVLVGCDNRKRLDWPMGRIVELIYGRDGVRRVAKVKTTTGILTRPVQRLFPLEISSARDVEDNEIVVKIPIKQQQQDPRVTKPITTDDTFQTKSGRTVKKPIRYTQ